MSIRYCYKNSSRNYLSDYSNYSSKCQIDMTLSGKFLGKYPGFNLNDIEYDRYFLQKDLKTLENIIKRKFNLQEEVIISSSVNGALQNIIKIIFANQNGKKNLVTPFYTFDQAEYAVTSFLGYTKRVYCDNYEISLRNILKAIDKNTKMVYLCNPNNPTGMYIESEKIIDFASKCNTLVVVDESGIEYTGNKSILEYKNIPDNIIVLRSFSKAYGLANLRIGYFVCGECFKKKYMENITINEVSGVACKIVEEILQKYESFVKINIDLVIKEREIIISELEKLNIRCLKSYSNIVMTETTFSEDFLKKLMEHEIKVIPVYDEYNKIHIRIAIQDIKINRLFIRKIKEILAKGSDYV